nr:MAG TPA: putative HD superfamily hydrolase [Caudoviricetes sp.]
MTESDRIKKFIEFMPTGFENTVPELQALGFFTAPASTKYHGAYHGGLFDHSLTVAENLVKMTKKLGLKWDRERSPYIVGMFHDICKCDNYKYDIETDKYIYNPDIIIPGHGDKSIIMLSKNMDLTDEEIACIRWHMGAFETDPKMWEYYGRAIEEYPNVLYTHTADMFASRIAKV